MNQASSHLQTLGVRLEKPYSSCRTPGAKVVLPFSVLGGSFLPRKKKSPLPFPSHSLGSAHPRAEAAVWSQGGITSLEHPSGFAAFPVNPADESWIRRTHGQGEAVTPQGFPLPSLSSPAAFLPPCRPSWQAAPAWFQASQDPGLCFGHPRLSPRHKHISGHLLVVLPFPPCPLHL